MKTFLVLLLILLSSSAQARGNEGGGGGGVLARLLISSQDYLRRELPRIEDADAFQDQPELRRLYLRVRKEIASDLQKVQFISVEATLRDPHMNYVTWIRIHAGRPLVIEYNPSVELYVSLVDSRLMEIRPANAPASEEPPRLRDVMAFLIHEMGHAYGLNEEQAWKFAFGLQAALDKRSSAVLKTCVFSYSDPSVGSGEYLQKEFTLGGMDSVLLTTNTRVFSFAHAFRPNARPQLALSVTNSVAQMVELNVFIGADSPVSLLQALGSQNGFMNLQCEVNQ